MTTGTDPIEARRVKEERAFWSRIAPKYDDWVSTAFRDQYRTIRPLVTGTVGPEDDVLELGTGTGDIAFHLAGRARSVIGVDISPEMIDVASTKLEGGGPSNVEFQVADAYALPFDDQTFDRVVCVNALQVMKDPATAIKKAWRVLKEGGEFVSVTYMFGDSGPWETIKLTRWVIRLGMPRYWSNLKADRLKAMFEGQGYRIQEEEWVWQGPKVLFLRAWKPVTL